ncbi:unnamed protein product [Arctogadus glacialis]
MPRKAQRPSPKGRRLLQRVCQTQDPTPKHRYSPARCKGQLGADKQPRQGPPGQSASWYAAETGLCVPSFCADYRQHCLIETPKSWLDAQSYCRERGYDLATIDDMGGNEISAGPECRQGS